MPPGDREARGWGSRRRSTFLGFTHICATTRSGRFWVRRITISKRMRAKLREVKDRAHAAPGLCPSPSRARWLASVVRGHMAYYAVPGNSNAVRAFRDQVARHWYKALRRRSQRTRLNWARMDRLATRWLPQPASCIHGRSVRFDATHPRQEPSAVIPHAGICAGGRPQGRSLPRPSGPESGGG